MRRTSALVAALFLAPVTAFTAGRASAPAEGVAAAPRAPSAAASGAPTRSPVGVVSADARISPGHARTVLSVRALGRWTASCSRDRLVRVVFTAHRLLPTSDVVVTRTAGTPLARRVDPGDRVAPDPPGAVLAQRWQIAPFAAAQVQVSVANVAGRTVGLGCAASVLVTTGPDQGPTITG